MSREDCDEEGEEGGEEEEEDARVAAAGTTGWGWNAMVSAARCD